MITKPSSRPPFSLLSISGLQYLRSELLNIFRQFIACLAASLLMASAAPSQSLEAVQKSFLENYDALNFERDQKLEKLSASYLGALERMLDQVKNTGDLDAVLPVRDEITAIQKGTWPLNELPKTSPRKLPELRGKYLEARGKIIRKHAQELIGLAGKMQALLKDKEVELTRAGQIEQALAAKRMRETLAEDKSLAAATDLLDDARASTARGEWRLLLNEDYEVTQSGRLYVGPVSPIPPNVTNAYNILIDRLRKEKEPPEQILMSVPPAIVKFQLEEKVTAIRGKALLANAGGNAAFKISAGDKVIYEKQLRGKEQSVSFEVEFAPTKKVTLTVDPLGTLDHDWCAWVKPEIR